MTVLSQFKIMLSELENSEKLVEAFSSVESVFNDTIKTMDKAKEQNRALSDNLKSINELFELEEFSLDTIKSKLGEPSKDVEKLKAQLTEKYEKDLSTLRSELQQKETSLNDISTKFREMMFTNKVIDGGLLSDFVDEPMARRNIIEMIKPRLLEKDGNFYAKDNTSGDIAKDIRTGEFLTAKNVIDEIKSTINPMYLKPQSTTQGTGATASRNATPPQNLGSDNKDRAAAIKAKYNL